MLIEMIPELGHFALVLALLMALAVRRYRLALLIAVLACDNALPSPTSHQRLPRLRGVEPQLPNEIDIS